MWGRVNETNMQLHTHIVARYNIYLRDHGLQGSLYYWVDYLNMKIGGGEKLNPFTINHPNLQLPQRAKELKVHTNQYGIKKLLKVWAT